MSDRPMHERPLSQQAGVDLVAASLDRIAELKSEVERLRGQRDAAREALDAAERELGSAGMSVKDAADRWEDGYLLTTADALALASERARAALASTVPSEEQREEAIRREISEQPGGAG